MTPAQDATALADYADQIVRDGLHPVLSDEQWAMIAAALRAVPQMPDAVREARMLDTLGALADRLEPAYRVEIYDAEGKFCWALTPDEQDNVVASLRATSQTPDAVREELAELVANRDGNTLGESRGINIADHDKEKYRKFADRILKIIASHSTPSASAGPQAEAVRETAMSTGDIADLADAVHNSREAYLNSIGTPLETACKEGLERTLWNDKGSFAPALRELADRRLYAHPQPQQADGRGAVIEALEHITELLVDTWSTAMPGDPEKEIAVFDARAALQQSPATDGPAK